MKISTILTCYKRPEYLLEQIHAIKNQTVPTQEILVWHNTVPDKSLITELHTEGVKSIYSEVNFKFHSRFALGLLCQNEYIALFDDDTIPGKKWYENCIETFKLSPNYGILGTTGVVLEGTSYDPHHKVGWNGIKSNTVTPVDLVGHAWFLKRETLFNFWSIPPISYENGEDIQLSIFNYLVASIETGVPPHPEGDKEKWGSIKGMEYGNDIQASHRQHSHAPLRNQITSTAISQLGYKTVLNRKQWNLSF